MRRVILAIVSTAAVLVFLLSFKTHTSSVLAISPPSASANPAPSGSASAGSPASSSASSSSASGTSRTVTGDAAQTFYGPVQVEITVKDGKITAANVTEYPNNTPRDAQINAYAIPQLNSEAISASSAQIDAISGATYTSNGYINSLQSALNKAGL